MIQMSYDYPQNKIFFSVIQNKESAAVMVTASIVIPASYLELCRTNEKLQNTCVPQLEILQYIKEEMLRLSYS